MKRVFALLLAAALLCSLMACQAADKGPSLAEQLDQIQVPAQKPEDTQKPSEPSAPTESPAPEEPEPAPEVEEPADKAEDKPAVSKPVLKPKDEEPEKPQAPIEEAPEAPDLRSFDGVYRAVDPGEESDDMYVTVRGFNEFILLEFDLTIEGSVYSFWAEEFWPNADGFDGKTATIRGLGQEFSLMSGGNDYAALPHARSITLTEDGVNISDGKVTTKYVRDEDFAAHGTQEEQQEIYAQVHGEQEIEDSLTGHWAYWDGWDTICIELAEDGGFHFWWKSPGEPVAVMDGVWGVNTAEHLLNVTAEKVGSGTMPHMFSWQYELDEYGTLWLTEEYPDYFADMAGYIDLWPSDETYTCDLPQHEALGYLYDHYNMDGEYTDENEQYYYYSYHLPQFLEDSGDMQQINAEILDRFGPRIESEMAAMSANGSLDCDFVSWERFVTEDILTIFVCAYGYESGDDYATWYYDLQSGEQVYADELLQRMDIDQTDFLDTLRGAAEEFYANMYAEMDETQREANGYDDQLAWTTSTQNINLDLPIWVDHYGDIGVATRIGSIVGPAYIWTILYPYAEW